MCKCKDYKIKITKEIERCLIKKKEMIGRDLKEATLNKILGQIAGLELALAIIKQEDSR